MSTFLKFTAFSFITLCVLAIAGPPLAALLLSAAIAAVGVHYFTKSSSMLGQIIWGSVIAVGVLSALSNIPGLIVIAIAAAAYYYYQQRGASFSTTKTDDPFDNFEREWAKMTK
ncbi:MAG: ABC transporter permease [Caryophanon sp.]|nr:ABC transporter permease [Caryophanon sp.]